MYFPLSYYNYYYDHLSPDKQSVWIHDVLLYPVLYYLLFEHLNLGLWDQSQTPTMSVSEYA